MIDSKVLPMYRGVFANRWILPSEKALNVVHTPKNEVGHTLWGVYQ